MKQVLPYLFWIGLGLLSFHSFGQITIDFPTDRAILQRDKNNTATIFVAGSYATAVDRIEVKLTAINEGTSIDWTPIPAAPQGGLYTASLEAKGGWYTLEVRGKKGDQVVGTNQVGHVGVGEVFLIAGQSNGQGFDNYGGPGAQDDRVSCVNYSNTELSGSQDMPYPEFTHLSEHAHISPRGISAWSWGKLGDLLTSRLKVPVLFYNVAWYSSSVANWVESVNGTTYSAYATGVPFVPTKMPYGNFRSVIQRYTPITGLRGVLWLQGEAEVQAKTDTDTYYLLLRNLIETGRNESGKNISWVVSLTSYDNKNGVNSKTIDGQKKVIASVPNVFQGPSTDGIQIPRNGGEFGVHFDGNGLVQLAEAWNNQLNDDFFSRSEPFKGISPLQVTDACPGNGNLSLSVNAGGFSSVSWSSGQNATTIQVGNGTYRATARDDRGNYIFSPEIRITQPIQPLQPTISLVGSNPVCLGNTTTLVSSTAENVTWNTGSTTSRVAASQGGEYFVTTKNVYGCESTSAKVAITLLTSPLPDKPVISASGAVTFCDGGEVNLQSNAKVNSLWSSGANTPTIQVRTSGEYRVKAVDNFGCFSPDSDPVLVKVNPLPQKPSIALSGPATFCDGGQVMLTSSFNTGNLWSSGATSKVILVNTTGKFSVRERDANGCESTSDEVSIKVNALPATPAITALRPTTFCLNDYTTLQSSQAYAYQWSNGATGKEIEIRQSGVFTIAARDENGCVSPISKGVTVIANPNPPTPVITADGPTTFCENLSVNLRSSTAAGFLWNTGAITQALNVTSSGTYSIRTSNEFKCFSNLSNEIRIQTLPLPPPPVIEAAAATTFCDGDFVLLNSREGNLVQWSTGVGSNTLKVSATGSYFATNKDDKGCFSVSSNRIGVEAKPNPSVPVIRQTGTYTLAAQNNINGGDHIWKRDGAVLSETGVLLKAVESGSYVVNNSITYSTILTCFSGFSAPFAFKADDRNSGIVAYPNPVMGDQVTIETLINVSNAVLQVVDSKGVVHKSMRIERLDTQKLVDVSGLPGGLYLIRLISAELNAVQKVVVVH